jgi:hypothetical protein
MEGVAMQNQELAGELVQHDVWFTPTLAVIRQREGIGRVDYERRRTDLLLVESNPLEDVKNVSKRAGVMVNGRWLTEEELKQRVAALRKSYQH